MICLSPSSLSTPDGTFRSVPQIQTPTPDTGTNSGRLPSERSTRPSVSPGAEHGMHIRTSETYTPLHFEEQCEDMREWLVSAERVRRSLNDSRSSSLSHSVGISSGSPITGLWSRAPYGDAQQHVRYEALQRRYRELQARLESSESMVRSRAYMC